MSESVDEILEGNKLIAEFMGFTYGDLRSFMSGVRPMLYKKNDKLEIIEAYSPNRLEYNSSWDWLKPVVDKIFTYSLAYKEQTERLRKTSIVVDITPCWQICVDFINWYNNQPKTK